jgi:hypothetical protein
MTIYYIDELGEIAVDIDDNSIQFYNGEVYFSSDGKDYRIDVLAIIEIVKN